MLRFEAPKSFTGEDVVELHCHGGKATVDGVLEAPDGVPAAQRGGARRVHAARHAAGKLGLTEVEGLADLLMATTPTQRRPGAGPGRRRAWKRDTRAGASTLGAVGPRRGTGGLWR